MHGEEVSSQVKHDVQYADGHSRNPNIRHEKVVHIPPPTQKDREAVDDEDDGEENERQPRNVWLEARLESHFARVVTLRGLSFAEPQERHADGNPGPETGGGDQVGKLNAGGGCQHTENVPFAPRFRPHGSILTYPAKSLGATH